MGQLGDYQSLFQLAAGLSIGIVALETILQSPVTKMKPAFQLTLIQVKSVYAGPVPPHLDTVKTDLDCLSKNLQTAIDTDLGSQRYMQDWALILTRVIGFISAFVSIFFLFESSENFNAQLSGCETEIALLLIAAPMILTIGLLYVSERRITGLEEKRLGFESKFLELVDRAWGLKEISGQN
jgi:hypothetical protein